MTLRRLALPATLVIAGWLAGYAAGGVVRASTPGVTVCSDSPCIVGSTDGTTADTLRVMGPRGQGVNHVLNVTDWAGNTMLMVNPGQVATGDLPLCVTGNRYNIEACLSPGTWNPARGQFTGSPFLEIGGVRLTIADLRWIHRHGG